MAAFVSRTAATVVVALIICLQACGVAGTCTSDTHHSWAQLIQDCPAQEVGQPAVMWSRDPTYNYIAAIHGGPIDYSTTNLTTVICWMTSLLGSQVGAYVHNPKCDPTGQGCNHCRQLHVCEPDYNETTALEIKTPPFRTMWLHSHKHPSGTSGAGRRLCVGGITGNQEIVQSNLKYNGLESQYSVVPWGSSDCSTSGTGPGWSALDLEMDYEFTYAAQKPTSPEFRTLLGVALDLFNLWHLYADGFPTGCNLLEYSTKQWPTEGRPAWMINQACWGNPC